MIKPEQIPKEVVEAFQQAWEELPALTIKECLASALNAWPGMEEHITWPEEKLSHIILPMEAGDE